MVLGHLPNGKIPLNLIMCHSINKCKTLATKLEIKCIAKQKLLSWQEDLAIPCKAHIEELNQYFNEGSYLNKDVKERQDEGREE